MPTEAKEDIIFLIKFTIAILVGANLRYMSSISARPIGMMITLLVGVAGSSGMESISGGTDGMAKDSGEPRPSARLSLIQARVW
jgi:hypothetical protein